MSMHSPELEVARACRLLQFLAVLDRDAAARIVDQVVVAHLKCYTSHAWTIDAERSRDLLVRKLERLLTRAVLQHQQPGAKSLLDRVIHIADRSLRDLANVVVHVRKK